MRLTREKSIRLSHVITDLLVACDDVEFIEDRDTIRQKTLQILLELLKEEPILLVSWDSVSTNEAELFRKGISWKEVPLYSCSHPKSKFLHAVRKGELPNCGMHGCPIYGQGEQGSSTST